MNDAELKTSELKVPEARQSLFEPRFFGRYLLIDQISRGGMSDIFLAKSQSVGGFQKPLVIKKLLPAYALKPRYVKRFINEAKTLSRLNHSNIVQIFDMGVINSEYFISLELIEGRNIAHMISKAVRTSRLPSIELAIFITLQTAKGLAYAHRKKGSGGENLMLVHQDVNSFNVMISYEAEVKIIDFGIARIFLDKATSNGLPIAGKLLYFSPEQLLRKNLDRRVDIYGTGVLLYELLTGERLVKHQETIPQTVKTILEMDITSKVRDHNRIPEPLKPILVRAMASDRNKRYSWIEELIDALESVVQSMGLILNQKEFSNYLKEQFSKEIVLDRRRMRRLLSEGRSAKSTSPTKDVSKEKLPLVDQIFSLNSNPTISMSSDPAENDELSIKSISVDSGREIVKQGDTGREIFIVQKGKVRLFFLSGDQKQSLHVLEPGELFGENSLLPSPINYYSAVAEGDCTLVVIEAKSFSKLIGRDVSRQVLIKLIERIRDSEHLIEGLLMNDALSRFLFGILYFDRRANSDGSIDLMELRELFSIPNEEAIDKYLKKLESLKVLEIDENKINVLDSSKLVNIFNVLAGRGKFLLKI